MEYLRWILLVAGILFVLIVYLVGRKTKHQNTAYDYEIDDDAPEFNATEWQDTKEGVGDVHIVAREEISSGDSDDSGDEEDSLIPDKLDDAVENPDGENIDTSKLKNVKEGIVVLHIMARPPSLLAGDKINSTAQANDLVFGDMKVFHRVDENGRLMFSMANMVEPGNFDPDTMLEMETPGLVLFMQQSSSVNNFEVFEEMLECAYHMSEMLGADLCNQQRQPMTQSDAEQYRELVTGFDG